MHAIILVHGAYPHLHTYVSFFNYLFLSCGRPERCVWQPGGDIRELLRGQPEYRMANRGRGRQARSPGMAELRTRDLWHSWSGRSLHGPSLLLVSRWALATDLKQTSAEQYPPGPGYCTMAYLTDCHRVYQSWCDLNILGTGQQLALPFPPLTNDYLLPHWDVYNALFVLTGAHILALSYLQRSRPTGRNWSSDSLQTTQ